MDILISPRSRFGEITLSANRWRSNRQARILHKYVNMLVRCEQLTTCANRYFEIGQNVE